MPQTLESDFLSAALTPPASVVKSDLSGSPIHARPRSSLAGRRVPALDGFRGWAVLAVMLYHFALPLAAQHHSRAWWATLHLMLTGAYGVDMFFVLSGFLITGILLDSKSHPAYFCNFYMRRILRIFPLYYGVLAVCFGVLWWSAPIKPFVPKQQWLWLYVTNFAGLKGVTFEPIFDHFWSLAVEEQFYLAWPLVVLLLSRRSLITVAATMALGSMILRCMLIQSNVSTDEIVASLTPCRLDGLGLGALLAALSRGPQGLGGIAKPAGFIAAGGAMAFVACKLLVHSSGGVWGMSGVGLFAEVLALSGLLALSTAEGTICNQLFTLSPLRFLGKYSYGLYVFHFLLHPWLDAHFWLFPYLPLLSLAAHMVGAVTATLVVALISWHCYERLFLELKHRYDDKAVPESGEEDVKESDPQATFRTIAA